MEQYLPSIASNMVSTYAGEKDKQFKQQQEDAEKTMKNIGGAARYMQQAVTRGNPGEIQGTWNAIRPMLQRRSPEGVFPDKWDNDTMVPVLHEVLAQTASAFIGKDGDEMKSLTRGQNGNYWAIRNGQFVDTGVAYDPTRQLRDQPGIEPGLVTTSGPTAGAVSPIGAPAGAAPAAALAPGELPFRIDPAIPPEAQAAIRANQPQWAATTEGNPINMLEQPSAPPPQQRQWTQNTPDTIRGPQTGPAAMRPAVTPAQEHAMELAREANARAEEAGRRAADAAARAERGSLPTGMRWNADGTAGEPIPGVPDKVAGGAASEGERKAATLLRRLDFSLGQLQQAVKESPNAAAPSVAGAVAGALPFVGDVARNTVNSSERQRVESAQLDILDAALTLGTGAAYTREQLEGYRKSYFPQLNDTPANIKDKAARLANVVEAARVAAGRAPGGTSAPGAAQPPRNAGAPVKRARNPQTGEVVELRNGQWVPAQ